MTGHQEVREETPASVMSKSMAEFAHDVTTLAELQVQLFVLDTKQCLSRAVTPVLCFIVAVGLILSCIAVALVGIGYLLVEAGLPHGWAFLLTSLLGLIVAAALGYTGWKLLQNSLNVLQRSQQELKRNIKWIKNVLKQKGRRPATF